MISGELKGLNRLQAQLRALRLSPQERKQLHHALAKKARMFSAKRVTTQSDLDHIAFAKRKRRRKRGKMLSGLKKRMKVLGNPALGKVFWQTDGKLAYKHQHGYRETVTARKFAERERKQKPDEEASHGGKATKAQAVALIKAGYLIPKHRKSRGSRRPTQRWIIQNLIKDQAAKLLRIQRGVKARWTTTLPRRAFLGVNRLENEVLIDYIFEKMTV